MLRSGGRRGRGRCGRHIQQTQMTKERKGRPRIGSRRGQLVFKGVGMTCVKTSDRSKSCTKTFPPVAGPAPCVREMRIPRTAR